MFFTNETLMKFTQKFQLYKNGEVEYKSVYAFKYDTFIQRFVDSLLDILEFSKNTRANLLYNKFEEIMLYLIDSAGTNFLYSLIENSDTNAQKFIQTVEKNQFSKLKLKEIAFLCGMSVSTFKREFNKYYSMSPIKWFKNKRLEYAFHLLNYEQKSSSEIYFLIGYENLSSFISAYKTKYGITPKQHHKKLSF